MNRERLVADEHLVALTRRQDLEPVEGRAAPVQPPIWPDSRGARPGQSPGTYPRGAGRMKTLRVTLEWLDGRYHGEEWPPSPWRLFQAVVAGLGPRRRLDPALEAALRHLETLGPPAITAPPVERLCPVTSRVPNNDGDLVLALEAKGEARKARSKAARLATLRTRRAWRVEGAIAYDFDAAPATEAHLPALVRAARAVSAFGHGIDLAFADAALLGEPAPVPGVRHAPCPNGRLLAVPWPGSLDALDARHRRERSRVRASRIEIRREPSPRIQGYRSALEPPPARWEAFALKGPDGGPLAVDGARAMAVAGMVRHALKHVARRAGLHPGVISELMGHGGERRVRVQPLPSVGHRHADGRVRRVLLTAPSHLDEDAWESVTTGLCGAALKARGGGTAGFLAPLPGTDPVLARFLGEGLVWTTATPVVLPGWDSRRGRVRPGRAVRRLLRHAGVDEDLLASAVIEPCPRLGGSGHARSYLRPAHLARYPATHLSLAWTTPVRGPLALGAGAGYGLGLLVPLEAALLDGNRGDVEGNSTGRYSRRTRWHSPGPPGPGVDLGGGTGA